MAYLGGTLALGEIGAYFRRKISSLANNEVIMIRDDSGKAVAHIVAHPEFALMDNLRALADFLPNHETTKRHLPTLARFLEKREDVDTAKLAANMRALADLLETQEEAAPGSDSDEARFLDEDPVRLQRIVEKHDRFQSGERDHLVSEEDAKLLPGSDLDEETRPLYEDKGDHGWEDVEVRGIHPDPDSDEE